VERVIDIEPAKAFDRIVDVLEEEGHSIRHADRSKGVVFGFVKFLSRGGNAAFLVDISLVGQGSRVTLGLHSARLQSGTEMIGDKVVRDLLDRLAGE